MTILSNSLADLAEEVRLLIADADVHFRISFDQTLKAGEKLVEARDHRCKHGEWLPFLERAGINKRSAQQYMQLARAPGVNAQLVALLGGMRGTLEVLAKLPKRDEIVLVAGEDEQQQGAMWESEQHPGYFHVWALNYTESFLLQTRKPWAGAAAMWGLRREMGGEFASYEVQPRDRWEPWIAEQRSEVGRQ